MVRDLNKAYVEPLSSLFPPERLGPAGDGPKVGCATCHAGAYKPLLGVSMLKDYRVLAEAKPQPEKTPVAEPSVATDAGVPETAGASPDAAHDAGAALRGPAGMSTKVHGLPAAPPQPMHP